MTASLDDIKRPIFFQTRCKACLSACPDLSCSARTLVDCSVHQLSGMAITSLSNRMELEQHEATLPALPLNLERMATHPLHPNLCSSFILDGPPRAATTQQTAAAQHHGLPGRCGRCCGTCFPGQPRNSGARVATKSPAQDGATNCSGA